MKFLAWLVIGTIVFAELVTLGIVVITMYSCFRVLLEWLITL
jgi:hypothetical protein